MSGLQTAVVDTDVFGLLFVRRGSSDPRIPRWRELLTGRQVLISFQTRAELLAGALADSWGERRMIDLRVILDRTPTIRTDNEVIDAHAPPNAADSATVSRIRGIRVTAGLPRAPSQRALNCWLGMGSTSAHPA